MRSLYIISITALSLIGCNSTKKAVTTTPETQVIVTETVVEVPQTTTPIAIDTDVIDTPEPLVITEEIKETPTLVEEAPAPEVIPEEIPEPDAPAVSTSFDHSTLDTVLNTYVNAQGNVNYAGIKSRWKSLRDYIAALGTNMPTDAWSQEEKLSYWMNAYNAMTVDLILRNYPLESIKDIKDPWDQRFWKLGNKWYNLNEIEHQILRKMGDPRIHFGINCASFSCPTLLNEAFTPQKVDTQLEALSKKFINDPSRNTITPDRVDVSKIFTWFAKDFKKDGSLIDFLNKYSETQILTNAKVRYREYDWSLNK